MRIVVEAVFDGVQWDGFLKPRRTKNHADVLLEERPELGAVVEGKLCELVDPDPYEARRIFARDTFGGEAFVAVGRRTPPGRDV